jgi:RNA polymerase sigma factor (sigma-70 family)
MPLPAALASATERLMSARARQDLALVNAALAGQASAYEELLAHYRAAVYHLVLKLVRQADDAEDLTMETFGKAFRHLGRYSPQFAFSTVLFRIATNGCIDFRRRKKLATLSLQAPAHRNEGSECTLELCDDELNPQEAFIRQQRCERVRDAVARLPVKYVDLVRPRYFEELSYEEVAAELQWPMGTVKAHLNRARALLAVALEGSEEEL